MIITSTDEAQAELARLFAQSQRATGFTGAGISTECGVPDFRSPNSPWMKHRPIDFSLFRADPLAREAGRDVAHPGEHPVGHLRGEDPRRDAVDVDEVA